MTFAFLLIIGFGSLVLFPNQSPAQLEIVGTLSNFDAHHFLPDTLVDNLELDFFGNITPGDIWAFYDGWNSWGTPPRVTEFPPGYFSGLPGGIEVTWMDRSHPLKYCERRHFGLRLDPHVPPPAVQAYWTKVIKVAQIPVPWQSWETTPDGVRDIIRLSPNFAEQITIARQWATLRDPVPLKNLNWDVRGVDWTVADRIPVIIKGGASLTLDIPVHFPDIHAALVRYQVTAFPDTAMIITRFVNEAILEHGIPVSIVGTLSNFDAHNWMRDQRPVDNLELDFFGQIGPDDIWSWYEGPNSWGIPPWIRGFPPGYFPGLPGGVEVTWMDRVHPIPFCQRRHFGLEVNPDIPPPAVQAYWTRVRKVAQIPVPWQFWRTTQGGVRDIIRLSNTFPEPVVINREAAVVADPVPLERLNWELPNIRWQGLDGPEGKALKPGDSTTVDIPVPASLRSGGVLLRYTVALQSNPANVITRFVNEAEFIRFRDTLLVHDTYGVPGTDSNAVVVELINSVNVAGVEFILTDIPDRLHAQRIKTTARTTGFSANFHEDTTGVKVLLVHTGGGTIPSGRGPILQLLFRMDSAAEFGKTIDLVLHHSVVSDPGGLPIPVAEIGGVMTIGLKGDINADGRRNILDVVLMVNIILGKITPTPYQKWAADCNDDGFINILDVVRLINWILHPSFGMATEKASFAQEAQIDLPPMNLEPGARAEWPLMADFDGSVSGLQLKIKYDPAMVELAEPILTERTKAMELAVAKEKDFLTVLLYSSSGENIGAGIGPILNFQASAKPGVAGNAQISLEEAVLADLQGLSVQVKTSVGALSVGKLVPQVYALEQNYPNPFNMETVINYQIPQAGSVSLKVFNLLGKEIRTLVDREMEAGYHKVSWNGKDNQGRTVASGIYLYRLQAGNFTDTRKLIMMK